MYMYHEMKIIARAAALLLLSGVVAANAESRKACEREVRETFGASMTNAVVKRQCNPTNFVTSPSKYGWVRDKETDCKPERVKGEGAKQLRDALCWFE